MPCSYCVERPKDWNGDDPKCAFESGTFSGDNWNCALANKVREKLEGDTRVIYADDDWYAAINISHIWTEGRSHGRRLGTCFWVSWYKSRGRTENMLILGNGPARPVTSAELDLILAEWEPGDSETEEL